MENEEQFQLLHKMYLLMANERTIFFLRRINPNENEERKTAVRFENFSLCVKDYWKHGDVTKHGS